MLILLYNQSSELSHLWNWHAIPIKLPVTPPHPTPTTISTNHLYGFEYYLSGITQYVPFVTGLLHLVLSFSCQYSTVSLFIAVSFLILTALLVLFSFIFSPYYFYKDRPLFDYKVIHVQRKYLQKKTKKALLPEFST